MSDIPRYWLINFEDDDKPALVIKATEADALAIFNDATESYSGALFAEYDLVKAKDKQIEEQLYALTWCPTCNEFSRESPWINIEDHFPPDCLHLEYIGQVDSPAATPRNFDYQQYVVMGRKTMHPDCKYWQPIAETPD